MGLLNKNIHQVESTISPSANLTITMTIQPKQKRHTKKYRAVARTDGVIIEYPQYQPPNSPPRQAFQFEKKVFTFDNHFVLPKAKKPMERIERRTEDLLDIGAFTKAHERDGYNEPLECGRGGYNGAFDLGRALQVELQALRGCQKGIQSPMRRFLAETGPWNSYELKEG